MNMEVMKEKCKYCGKEISKSNISKHIRSHENGNFDKHKSKTGYYLDHEDLFCKFCNKECKNKNSLRQHEIRCKNNPQKINYKPIEGFNNFGRIAWNKNLTKETDERVLRQSIAVSKPLNITYKYHEHNEQEIGKWLNYIDIIEDDIIIPKYTVRNNGGRPIITSAENELFFLDRWKFESDYLMNVIFNGSLASKNTIHHIDNNSSNNNLRNLMVFKDKADHNRFHHSNNAYLFYNEDTHIFECIIKK